MNRLQLPDEHQVNTIEQGQSMQLQQLALHIKPAKSWILGDDGKYSLLDTDLAEFVLTDRLNEKKEGKIYPAYNLAELVAMLGRRPTFMNVQAVASSVIGLIWKDSAYYLDLIRKRYEKLCTTSVNN